MCINYIYIITTTKKKPNFYCFLCIIHSAFFFRVATLTLMSSRVRWRCCRAPSAMHDQQNESSTTVSFEEQLSQLVDDNHQMEPSGGHSDLSAMSVWSERFPS